MAQAVRWLLWTGLLMTIPSVSRAAAAEVEHRDYQITVDGRPAGQYHASIARHENGVFIVSGRVDVHLRFALVINYNYTYRGTETWKHGRLVRLDSTCDDDGKQFTVHAEADGNRLRVRVNDDERTVRPDVWTTSCWRLPAAQHRNRDLVLLDADTGSEIAGHLHYVDKGKVDVAGQAQECTHYRVTGSKKLDLWFDAQERLIRQESEEDGHATVLQMTGLRR